MKYRFRKLGWAFCVGALAVLLGCTRPLDLKLQFNAGDKHTLKVTQDMNMTVKMGEHQQTMPMKVTTIQELVVNSVGPDGAASINVTFTHGELPQMGPFTEMFEELGAAEKFSMTGKSFTMGVTPDGHVTSVSGMDEIGRELADVTVKFMQDMMKRMFEQEGRQMPPAFQAQLASGFSQMEIPIRKMMREMVSNDTMQEQMERGFPSYPGRPVKVGESWNRTLTILKQFPMIVAETWTLRERADGVVKLDFRGTISPNPNAPPLEFMGIQMTMTLSGEMSGTAEIHEATGWPKSGTTTVSFTGEQKMGDMSTTLSGSGTTWAEWST